MKYSLISEESRLKCAPELHGRGHILVTDGQKIWVVKHKPGSVDEEKRDLLGYLLGKNIANIAEVKLLNPEEHQQICVLSYKDESSTPNNTFLVRLGGSYSLDELPCKTIEKAVAMELAYSTWIRRRDTHVDNRIYISGIPIFFDHQTAFLSESKYAHTTAFLRFNPDYGHPFFWRVKQISGVMTTERARGVNRQEDKAYHYVNNLDLFKDELDHAEKTLVETMPQNLKSLIKSTGFDDLSVDIINNFLLNNLHMLTNDLKQMKEIIFSSDSGL